MLKAFEQSKAIALEKFGDTSSTKVTLPFVEERLMEARALMGDDFWPYGVEANRKTLETFLRHHHAQGLSSRQVKVEELFHPARWRRLSFELSLSTRAGDGLDPMVMRWSLWLTLSPLGLCAGLRRLALHACR